MHSKYHELNRPQQDKTMNHRQDSEKLEDIQVQSQTNTVFKQTIKQTMNFMINK